MIQILLGAVALGLLWAITTIGVYVSYRVLDIADLSVEGTIVLGAAVSAMVIVSGGSAYVAIIAAALAGALAGKITALLHTALKIPSLLAGILAMIALYSINIRVMGGASNISLLRKTTVFTPFMKLGLDINTAAICVGLVCVTLVVGLVVWFLRTEVGATLRATGCSPQMAKAQGINIEHAKGIGYMLSNGLVGLSGGLIAQYLAFADVQMGIGSIVIGLASLIIGEVLFARGRGMVGTMVALVMGSIVYRVIIALVLEAGMRASDLKLFTAVTVAAALYLPVAREKLAALRGGRESA